MSRITEELARRDVIYLSAIPKSVLIDRVLVHNRVRSRRRLGSNGFRAWLSRFDVGRYEVCDCGWASELDPHYRVKHSILAEAIERSANR